jgi:hypothetical protein
MGLRLYDIAEALTAAMGRAEQYAEEHDGVIPDELGKELDLLEMARDEKIGDCIAYMKSEQAVCDALDAEAAKLTKRAERHSKNADWMKQYLSACVGVGTKWEGKQGRVSWRKSTSVEVVVPADKLPAAYVRVVPERREPDKRAIGDALKDGVEIAGCALVEKLNIQVK